MKPNNPLATLHHRNGLRPTLLFNALLTPLIGILLFGFPHTGAAQATTAEQKGVPSNSVFSVGDVDVVNLQNGNLHIAIPIETSAQRGGTTLKYAFEYDTQAWIKQWHESTCTPGPCNPPGLYVVGEDTNVTSSWRLTSPFNWAVTNSYSGQINCPSTSKPYEAYTNWAIIDPEGSQHPLPLRKEQGTYSCYGQTLAGPALDGSGMYYDSQAEILYTKDGYEYNANGVQDRNGNIATASLDTLDRNLVTTYNGTGTDGMPYTTYTISNSSGSPLIFTVNFQTVTITTDICSNTIYGLYNCTDYTTTKDLPSMLTLPTHKTYVFKYAPNTPGDLIEMDLPTGAVITYQYTDFYEMQLSPQPGYYPNFVGSRAVTKRTVAVNGNQYVWTYNLVPGVSSTVTDPLGNYQIHTFNVVHAMSGGNIIATSSNVYEMSVAYYNSSNQLLRTDTNTYTAEPDPVNSGYYPPNTTTANVRVTHTTTTLDSGQTSAKQTDYETFSYPCVYDGGTCTGTATRLSPTETREYDYGTSGIGALLRKTDYAYLHTNNQGYINLNIVDKPTVVTVYDGPSGTMIAQTTNEYDNYTHTGQPMQPSGAIQHNASYGTSFKTRGNLTGVSKWVNTTGTTLSVTNQYDDAGNLLSSVDSNGNKTAYSYSDSWASTACVPTAGTGAIFPTAVTNAKGQSASTTYFACTGAEKSMTDANKQLTQYSYDSYDRPLSITYPLGSKTFCYSDDPNGSCYNNSSLFSTETDVITGSPTRSRTTLYDGLGRVYETQLTSDPNGTVYVDTQYDGDGRAFKVSNPYRSGDTEYWTTKLFDGIGRSAGVLNQDGSATSITYTGNTTLSTDEVKNKRRSTNDALGRLTYIWEDPSGVNFETDYQYDALGNLLNVNQKGKSGDVARQRVFTYDSLSRLLTTSNPESGLVTYSYQTIGGTVCSGDASLPCSKTDARSVKISYSYDQLNRLVGKTYSDGTTASSCFQYDTPLSTVSDANPIGHLTLEWTQPGACPSPLQPQTAIPANAMTSSVLSNHDAMGQMQNEQQYTPASLAGGTYYSQVYGYDSAGDILSSTSVSVRPNAWSAFLRSRPRE